MKKYLILILFFSCLCHAAESQMQTLESLVSKYVDLKIERARTSAQWETDKKILEDEQALLEREKEFLARELKILETASEQTAQKLKELQSEIASLETFSQDLIPVIEKAEKEIPLLVSPLPSFLKAQLSQEEGCESLSSSDPFERISKLLKLYQRIQDFLNQIHVTHETLLLGDFAPADYEVLYLGASRAFFISRDDQRAGWGELSSQKWIWTEQDSLSAVIRKAISIHRNLSTAEYVSLPLSIKE